MPVLYCSAAWFLCESICYHVTYNTKPKEKGSEHRNQAIELQWQHSLCSYSHRYLS